MGRTTHSATSLAPAMWEEIKTYQGSGKPSIVRNWEGRNGSSDNSHESDVYQTSRPILSRSQNDCIQRELFFSATVSGSNGHLKYLNLFSFSLDTTTNLPSFLPFFPFLGMQPTSPAHEMLHDDIRALEIYMRISQLYARPIQRVCKV